MELNLLSKDLVVTEIVAQTWVKHRTIIQCDCANIPILRIIRCHMARNCGAAAVANKNELVAGGVNSPRVHHIIRLTASANSITWPESESNDRFAKMVEPIGPK